MRTEPGGRHPIFYLAIALIVIAFGGIGWFYYENRDVKGAVPNAAATDQIVTAPPPNGH